MLTTSHPATDNRIFYREAKTLAEAGLALAVIGPHHPKSGALDGVWIEALAKHKRGSLSLLYRWTVIRLALQLRAACFCSMTRSFSAWDWCFVVWAKKLFMIATKTYLHKFFRKPGFRVRYVAGFLAEPCSRGSD
jgi:hypothetical protein